MIRAVRVRYLHATAVWLPRTAIELGLMGVIFGIVVVAITTGDGAAGTVSLLGLFDYAGLRVQPALQRIVSSMNNLKFAEAPLEALQTDFHLTAPGQGRS